MNYKDNQLLRDENAVLELAALSVLGDRSDQQDRMGYALSADSGVAVVCDGMGGHDGGRLASTAAVEEILAACAVESTSFDPVELLLSAVKRANSRVCALTDSSGNPLRAGSTAVALWVGNGSLYWGAVGDSRAYLFRGGEWVCLTQDHNYLTVLNEKRNAGLIDEAEYARESVRGEALISFLGIGELNLIDYSSTPLTVYRDDKVLIMSDGLYKLVSDEEIARIIDNFNNIGDAVQALEMKAKKNSKNKQIDRDNMTVALIKIK